MNRLASCCAAQLLACLLAVGVEAKAPKTDGVICEDSSDARIPLQDLGSWKATGCYNVCDGYAAADTGAACNEWDFDRGPGMPDIMVFEYEDIGGDCGATPDFTITTGPVTGGSPNYDISTSAVVVNTTTDRIAVIIKDAMLNRFLFFAVTDEASCTDVDIRMFTYEKK